MTCGELMEINWKALWILLVLLILDLTLYLLSINQYYFVFLNSTGLIFPMLLNIILMCLIGWLSKLEWVFIVAIVLFIIFLFYLYFFTFWRTEAKYTYLDSPQKTETLVIRHWVATLGESNFIYKFYKNVDPLGLVIKKVDGQDLDFMIRLNKTYLTEDQVLDINHPNWISETQVIFQSIQGEKKITLE
ncbi:hypothetical protein SD71_14995 [Cohnella kolymensis]|uniref:Uncharacterized protein n=1 Tax=Cohnella kolymensis TaxID=1590652 RepID=A0ABR5A3K8_9BACL|nr:hypothetical protein SD71_14995 [Cohnella kolymensis]